MDWILHYGSLLLRGSVSHERLANGTALLLWGHTHFHWIRLVV